MTRDHIANAEVTTNNELSRRNSAKRLASFSRSYPGIKVLCIALVLLCGIGTVTPSLGGDIWEIDCGGLGQKDCGIFDAAYWRGGLRADGCDRGLEDYFHWDWFSSRIRCRSLWRNNLDGVNSWALDAYRNQLHLGENEPFNFITHLGAHNAYNNGSDFYWIAPNQEHSITEQLDKLGVRVIFLDVHCDDPTPWGIPLKLTHSTGPAYHVDRDLPYALREIREWLKANPKESVLLIMEDDITKSINEGSCHSDTKEAYINTFLWQLGGKEESDHDYLFRQGEKRGGRWPSRNKLRALGKQVIVLGDYHDPDFIFSKSEYFKYRKYEIQPNQFNDSDCNNGTEVKLGDDCVNINNHVFTGLVEGNFPGITEDSLFCDKSDPGLLPDGAGLVCPENSDGTQARCGKGLDVLTCGNVFSAKLLGGYGLSIIALDQLWGEMSGSGDYRLATDEETNNAIFEQSLVWSWEKNLKGWKINNEAAAMSNRSGTSGHRWYTADFEEHKRYACGLSRDGDPSSWVDRDDKGRVLPTTQWCITEEAGPWEDGGYWCLEQCYSENTRYNFSFSVPTNVLQHKDLEMAMSDYGADDIWLAYRDVDLTDGIGWQIDRAPVKRFVRAIPSDAIEGELIKFHSNLKHNYIFDIGAWGDVYPTGFWDFGDGSPELDGGIATYDQVNFHFSTEHRYVNDGTFDVKLSLYQPWNGENDPHHFDNVAARTQKVRNAAPELRMDCSVWSECTEQEIEPELKLFVGETLYLDPVFRDAGAADEHFAQVDWGDGTTEDMSIHYTTRDSAAIGGLQASHVFNACGSHVIKVFLADTDGGETFTRANIEVDDVPPTINCPPNLAVEASALQTPIDLGVATVAGGVCDDVEVYHSGPALYPLGLTQVNWTARNMYEMYDPESDTRIHLTDTCIQQVEMVDTTPPTIKELSVSPTVLWPPNNKMIPVQVTALANDLVDPSPSCTVVQVTSDEVAVGPGSHSPDSQIKGVLSIDLRAERNGKDDGRTYEITIRCSDFSGNSVDGVVYVEVPHDKR